jgi:hypothetical protein
LQTVTIPKFLKPTRFGKKKLATCTVGN